MGLNKGESRRLGWVNKNINYYLSSAQRQRNCKKGRRKKGELVLSIHDFSFFFLFNLVQYSRFRSFRQKGSNSQWDRFATEKHAFKLIKPRGRVCHIIRLLSLLGKSVNTGAATNLERLQTGLLNLAISS